MIAYHRGVVDAGVLVRTARQRAGLGQRELGVRAGVPQSAVSAYESGRTQPSMPVLERLVAAAGFELEVQLTASSAPVRRAFTGPVGRRVQRKRAALRQLLTDAGFGRPEVFGSVARGEDRSDSDVDVLVDVPAGTGLFALAGMRRQAAAVVGVPVDLVPRDGLKAAVSASIAADLVAL